MATLREYFDTNITVMALDTNWTMSNAQNNILPTVRVKIAQDYDANAKYFAFFIPEGCNIVAYINAILSAKETRDCILTSEGDPVEVQASFAGYSESMSSRTLVFTQRVFLYIDENLTVEDRQAITAMGAERGFHVVVYDKNYAKARSDLEKPLAFISHDSRDKDTLVRELALEMSGQLCPVWYDEYSLRVGDSLRANIERGLKETRKCIVVLSPHFLTNNGWGKTEFNSVFTREIIEEANVILPVWHNVTKKQVYDYSPSLADKLGLNSSMGVKQLAALLVSAVKLNPSPATSETDETKE
ncbi:hypothetical protein RugamoR57_44470 [Duganella caerulea]|uniref:toll/interleukin-1 receptor domain-containing protein n=1 Tax=Duganella caerulea TaxID=2885762 RepID=UPI0030E8926F